MDETGSAGREERPESSRHRREVGGPAERTRDERPHDPVTGTPATDDAGARTQPRENRSAEELEGDVRRTRAEMSETVGALERRLAPERLKRQAKGAVHETIDEVRDHYNPQRMAQRAGTTMMDTIKDHPAASLIAGLSAGYLLMKAGEGSSRYDSDGRYRRDYAGPPRGYYGERYVYDEAYAGPAPRYDRGEHDRHSRSGAHGEVRYEEQTYRSEGGHSAKNQAQEKAHEAQERTKEYAGQAQERASELAGEAQHRAQAAGRQVRRQARRTQNELDAFVHENPLAAGALAAGVGALLGSLLPSTEAEDAWMGPARDQAVRQAKQTAEGTLEQAQEAAGRVADEAEDAAKNVKATAEQESQRVKDTAQNEASDAKEEAKKQAKSKA